MTLNKIEVAGLIAALLADKGGPGTRQRTAQNILDKIFQLQLKGILPKVVVTVEENAEQPAENNADSCVPLEGDADSPGLDSVDDMAKDSTDSPQSAPTNADKPRIKRRYHKWLVEEENLLIEWLNTADNYAKWTGSVGHDGHLNSRKQFNARQHVLKEIAAFLVNRGDERSSQPRQLKSIEDKIFQMERKHFGKISAKKGTKRKSPTATPDDNEASAGLQKKSKRSRSFRGYHKWSEREEELLAQWFDEPKNSAQWKRAGPNEDQTKTDVSGVIAEYLRIRCQSDASAKSVMDKVPFLEDDWRAANEYMQLMGKPCLSWREAWQLKRKLAGRHDTDEMEKEKDAVPIDPDDEGGCQNNNSNNNNNNNGVEGIQQERLDYLSRKALYDRIWPKDAVERRKRRKKVQGRPDCHYGWCADCQLEFKSRAARKIHFLQHDADAMQNDDEEIRQCPECAFAGTCLQELIAHVDERHTRKDLHTCARCNRSFISFKRLERHIQQVHLLSDAEKPYECPTCHKRFAINNTFARHVMSHDGPVNIKCPLCDEKFRTTTLLSDHLLASHSVDGDLLCSICNSQFPVKCPTSFRDFRRHVRKHTSSGEFACTLCDKVFSRREGLQVHTKGVHSVAREHVCECGKSFATARHLVNHRRWVHTEGKVDGRKTAGKKMATGKKVTRMEGNRRDYVPRRSVNTTRNSRSPVRSVSRVLCAAGCSPTI
ncbi:uncharacterized protein LOC129595035 [Paramacrobiotus metropolitanus]|uniref:uncharacterized protein LOC129595035 n=1 Tax=Paramacrobiotus metropolitanus TaxID=2943436 RepID=UPI002445903F|nr:uncharacterized protein LOC129595035 [Paramacrobiotus metropolitanus]